MARDQVIFERTVREAVRRCGLLLAKKVGHASTSAPGLVPPLPGDTHEFLRGDGAWASVGATRQNVVITTAALANLATESANVASPSSVQALLTIQASAACWVRFYSSAATQAADAGRTRGTLPTAGTGVLAEFDFTTVGAAVLPCSPVAILANDETPPQTRLFYAVQNTSGGSAAITVTLNVLPSAL